MKTGIVRVLDQQINTIILKQLGDAQKSYRAAKFSFSTKLGITFYVPTQSVFSVKINDWVRWKGMAKN
jgi:hypothetical protein